MSVSGLFYHLSRILCEQSVGLLLRGRCWGRRNIPLHGPVILAVNHQSYLDPVVAGSFAPRIIHFMARDSLFRNRWFAALIRTYNAFPVKRAGADVAAFKHFLRVLKSGSAVMVFPEATRSADGRVRPMHAGVIGLARRANAPLVPAAIEGAYELWPRGSRFPRPAPVWVEYGRPMDPSAFAGKDDAESARLLTRIVRDLHDRLRRRAGRRQFEYAADEAGATEKLQAPVA